MNHTRLNGPRLDHVLKKLIELIREIIIRFTEEAYINPVKW